MRRRLSLTAVAVVVGGAAGCGGTKTCKDGTLFVTATFDSATSVADSVDVQARIDRGAWQVGRYSRNPGKPQESVEIDFPSGYPEGKSVDVLVIARKGGAELGTGSGTVESVPQGCGALMIEVGGPTDGGDGPGGAVGCRTSVPPPSALVTDFSSGDNLTLTGGIGAFGSPTSIPTFTTADGSLRISETAAASTEAQLGLLSMYFSGDVAFSSCVDASAYEGVKFDLSGRINGCSLELELADSQHENFSVNPLGAGSNGVYPPARPLTVPVASQTFMVPFRGPGAPTGGNPSTPIDPTKLTHLDWLFSIPANSDCTADITIDNVAFYAGSDGGVTD
jgi:hypothetical protein